MTEYRYIRKLRLRNYLLDHGFVCEDTMRDLKFPDRFVWKFRLTDELQQAIEDYYSLIPTK